MRIFENFIQGHHVDGIQAMYLDCINHGNWQLVIPGDETNLENENPSAIAKCDLYKDSGIYFNHGEKIEKEQESLFVATHVLKEEFDKFVSKVLNNKIEYLKYLRLEYIPVSKDGSVTPPKTFFVDNKMKNEYVFMFSTSDAGKIHIDDEIVDLKRNTMYVFDVNQKYRIEYDSEEVILNFYYIASLKEEL